MKNLLKNKLLQYFLTALLLGLFSVQVAQAQVPNAPTNLVVTPTDSGGKIQFTAPSSIGGSAISNYEYSTNGGTNWITPSPAITASPLIVSSGLTNCNSYSIKIRAVNTSGSGSASVAASLTPRASANPGINWVSRTSAADNNWSSVTYGNGLFVAVAQGGTGNRVMTSPDGITWTSRTSAADNNNWNSVIYGNGLFVAVAGSGSGNRVMTSPDGITWTSRTSAADNDWQGLTYGNGLFVAVATSSTGNRVMTSPDGINWTIRTSAADNQWNSVTYGNGIFVAVSGTGTGNRVMTSTNGITWTSRTPAVDNAWRSVTYGNGLFVAVGMSGTGNRVMTSPDGITWTTRSSASDNEWLAVTYGNGLFVAVAISGTSNRVMTSPDGINWTSRTSAENNSWQSLTYSNGLFVALATTGSGNRVMTSTFSPAADAPEISAITPRNNEASVAFTQTVPVLSPAVSNYEYSTDNGSTWTARNPASNASPIIITGLTNGTAYNIKIRAINQGGTSCTSNMISTTPALGTIADAPTNLVVTPSNTGGTIQFTAPANDGGSAISNYQYSTDGGTNWITPSPAITASPLIVSSGLTNCNSYSIKIRAVNTSGSGSASVAASLTPRASANPGIVWTSRASVADLNWISVTYGNGLFVAIAQTGTGNRVMTSPDGITWTQRSTPTDRSWISVTYGNNLFVAVSDGGGWGDRVMTSSDGITWTARNAADENVWNSVTYGNGQYVAVAGNGYWRVMRSSDGINWNGEFAAANNGWVSVTYGNGLFVAVSGNGTNRVMTSSDGITWTSRTSAANLDWKSVTYGNGLFVAVAVSGTGNRVMTSPDGINWTSRTSAADNDWKSVTYGNGLFVAVAYSGTGNRVMTSPDGITWTTRSSASNNNWKGVTFGNNIFVAVSDNGGSGNRVMTSSFSIAADAPVITAATLGTSATVNFTQSAPTLAPAITNYQYSTDNGTNWTAVSPAATTSPLTITGLSAQTNSIMIRAVNSVGNSCASNAYAQSAPSINYGVGAKTFLLNSSNSPLTVTNSGGTVQPISLQVTTFARGFSAPTGLAIDSSNNLYVIDRGNRLIKKITPAGVVTTIAGSGSNGTSDDANPLLASFSTNYGIAIDRSSNIYVTQFSGLLRKINGSTGAVTTIANTGLNQAFGIALDSSGTNAFVAANALAKVKQVTLSNGVVSDYISTPYPTGMSRSPSGFIHMSSNSGIQKIVSGVAQTSLVSGHQHRVHGFDSIGNLYYFDLTNEVIGKITPSGTVTTFAGISGNPGFVNGPALSAKFNNDHGGIVVDASGNVFLAEEQNGVIRKIGYSSYSISPDLPSGLVLDPLTGTISGTPTVVSSATTYTITAFNTSGTSTSTVNIRTIPFSSNADLNAMTISAGSLSPSFSSSTLSYTAGTVSNATTNVTVTPTNANEFATIEVQVNSGSYSVVTSGSPSSSLALNSGSNTINVKVTASDGTTIKIYTITVARTPLLTPYLNSNRNDVTISKILTVGDSTAGGYKMVGIPDGLGAFDNNNGTFTLLMNHEINSTLGVARAHGGKGAFVSKWVINKSDLSVVSGSDLIRTAKLWNKATNSYVSYNYDTIINRFSRFCSADLPPVNSFLNGTTGTAERIFLNGEENGVEGRAMAHIATGPNAGTSYELPYLGKFSWENAVATPTKGTKTIVAGMDDGTGGQVYFYIGTKTKVGTEIDKAGLTNGKLFGVKVTGLSTESSSSIPAAGTAFTLVDLGIVKDSTGAALEAKSVSNGVTTFLRPEDGAWDPRKPTDFYFVTTSAFATPSRLWKLAFKSIANPEQGGTITAMLDGTEGQKMMDNMAIDSFGNIFIQEDVGNNAHVGKTWVYNIENDRLVEIAQHDTMRFLNGATNFLTQDEEASGIIDMKNILGKGKFLFVDQAHYATNTELVEGGQLLAMTITDLPLSNVAIVQDSIEIGSIDSNTLVNVTASLVPNADTYKWTVPTGVVIVSGQGTRNLVVRFTNPVKFYRLSTPFLNPKNILCQAMSVLTGIKSNIDTVKITKTKPVFAINSIIGNANRGLTNGAWTSTTTAGSTGNIVNVVSTAGLKVGYLVKLTAGTGNIGLNNVVDSVISATQFRLRDTMTINVSASATLKSFIVPQNTFTAYTSAAGATNLLTLVTVTSTTGLAEGMLLSKTAGTGTLKAGTVVSKIIDATRFVISLAPTVNLSNSAVLVGTPVLTNICPIAVNSGLTSEVDYTVIATPVNNVGYRFTVPNGARISRIGDSTIVGYDTAIAILSVSTKANSIGVVFDPSFVSGTVSAQPYNNVGTALAFKISVKNIKAAIYKVTSTAPAIKNTIVRYKANVTNGSDVTSYKWTLPLNSTALSGSVSGQVVTTTTDTLSLSFGNLFNAASLKVEPINNCGIGTAKTFVLNGTTTLSKFQQEFELEEVIENSELTTATEVNVYPNPNQGNFTVSITSNEKEASAYLSIINMMGQEVASFTVENNNGTIETNINQGLADGLYFV
ncbi:MAG: cadherin-like beta sandwich domain-containing protein, partial [Bacteroidota bacterium]